MIENSRRAGAQLCTVAAILRGDHVTLDISDDGPGVAPADRARLFEPFFTTRRAEGGTGLGLPIARSLLDACGGAIRLEAAATGARFAIDLPLG